MRIQAEESLKQTEESLKQTAESLKMSKESEEQGKTLMVFTLVTIIFVRRPTFLTSVCPG